MQEIQLICKSQQLTHCYLNYYCSCSYYTSHAKLYPNINRRRLYCLPIQPRVAYCY